MGGIENIYNTLQICKHVFLIWNKRQQQRQPLDCLFHLPPTILIYILQAPGTPVLVLRLECEAEAMRWFQHLEAATHQLQSPRDVVPLLSVLVLRLFQDDGIYIFDAC